MKWSKKKTASQLMLMAIVASSMTPVAFANAEETQKTTSEKTLDAPPIKMKPIFHENTAEEKVDEKHEIKVYTDTNEQSPSLTQSTNTHDIYNSSTPIGEDVEKELSEIAITEATSGKADTPILEVQMEKPQSSIVEPPQPLLLYANKETVPAELFAHVSQSQQLQEEQRDITSTDDDRRNKALEEKYNIKLSVEDHWSSHYQNYSAHDTLKALGYYHVNANREALINYGIRTGDWQPYRAYAAESTPLYFEIVDGKFEYSKIYYGSMLSSIINSHLSLSSDDRQKNKVEYERQLKELTENFRNAPGIVPYVAHLNHNEELAKQHDVPMVEKGYFNSPYNHPDVLSKGKFAEKTPLTQIQLAN